MPAPNPSQRALPMINSKSLPLQDLPLPAVGLVPTHTLTLAPVTLPLPQGPCRSSSHFKYTRTQPGSSVNLTHPSDLSTAPDSPKEVGALIISLRGLHALGDSVKSVPGSPRRAGTTDLAQRQTGRHRHHLWKEPAAGSPCGPAAPRSTRGYGCPPQAGTPSLQEQRSGRGESRGVLQFSCYLPIPDTPPPSRGSGPIPNVASSSHFLRNHKNTEALSPPA